MVNGKKLVAVIHWFIIKDSEPIIQSYISDMMATGFYDKCDKILFNIRYDCITALNHSIKLMSQYDKLQIVNIEYEDRSYKSIITNIYKEIISGQKRILGHSETLIRFMVSDYVKNLISDMDIVVFIHSKSISHLTAPQRKNPRTKDTSIPDINSYFHWAMTSIDRFVNEVELSPIKIADLKVDDGEICAEVICAEVGVWNKINIQRFVEIVSRYSVDGEGQYKKWPKRLPHHVVNSVDRELDIPHMNERHLLICFGTVLNFFHTSGEFNYIIENEGD